MPIDASSVQLPTQSSRNAPTRSLVIVWVLAVLIGLGLAMTRMPSVFVDGQVHPLGYDGFYHATRILAIAENPTSTHAFDANLNWPKGLWVTWPWAYDYLGGVFAGLLSSDKLSASKIMAFYPLLWLIANITLIGMIAKEVLTPRLAAIALIAFAAAPITLSLHAVGKMDHHSAELFWLLLSMYFTGLWLKFPESSRIPVALGIILAAATSFHNILFLLQIPVLTCLFISRLSGNPTPATNKVISFGLSLLITQFLVLLPSHQFVTFEYAFYFHSWFHLHIALLTAVAAFAISKRQNATMWFLLVATALMSLPAVGQILYGLDYIKADAETLNLIKETARPFGGELSIKLINNFYSGLVWLLPFCVGYIIYQFITRRQQGLVLMLFVFCLFGFALLSSQVRFHNFGYVFLILIPLIFIQQVLPKGRDIFIASALFFGAYTLSLSNYLITPELGLSPRYSLGQPLIQEARLRCSKQPGLLLANSSWGNFLRYQTDCPLISNNFLITEQELEYAKLSVYYMGQSPESLRNLAPAVRYVLVSRLDASKLGGELLTDRIFDGFKVIGEMREPNGEVFGRLYRVESVPND